MVQKAFQISEIIEIFRIFLVQNPSLIPSLKSSLLDPNPMLKAPELQLLPLMAWAQ